VGKGGNGDVIVGGVWFGVYPYLAMIRSLTGF